MSAPIFTLIGIPGSGKGFHGARLQKRMSIAHISAGQLLRDQIAQETPVGRMAHALKRDGKSFPDSKMQELLLRALDKVPPHMPVLLDSFPRSKEQLDNIAKVTARSRRDIALAFELRCDLQTAKERIEGRLLCQGCNLSYHRVYDPPQRKDICDQCRGKLYQREDDRHRSTEGRIKSYEKNIAPVIDFYESSHMLVIINAQGPANMVTDHLEAAIWAQLEYS